jgi:catechol 2,3-dioxygenase-like lactoylglutathione lyase family enzyme
MKFHHMMLLVSDIDESLRLYRDVLGFELAVEHVIPDEETIPRETVDALWEYEGARSRTVILFSSGGSMLELQQPLIPKPARTPPKRLRYADTGIHEMGLEVAGIDEWFDKIRAAGYEVHGVDGVWEIGGRARTFLFYDPDGNLIQLWEDLADPRA